jgi:hypothetical protein
MIGLTLMAVGIDFKLIRVLLNYRTGSGSDLAVVADSNCLLQLILSLVNNAPL